MKSTICKYFKNNVAKINRKSCVDYENCQIYKFYQRYPTYLGCGTTMLEDIIRLEKEVEKNDNR